jgi:type IV pilus assembly protein PilB
VDRGLLTSAQLETAIRQQEITRKSFGRVLLELGFVTEDQLPEIIARWNGYEFVDLTQIAFDPAASHVLPFGLCRRHKVVPVAIEDERLVVALSDPGNVILIDDLRILTDREIKVLVATQADIDEALNRLHALDRSAETLLEQAHEEDTREDIVSVSEDAPIVKAINHIITQAVSQRASDIHVEPEEHDVRIRYRIDGVLHEVMRVPGSQQQGVISRLKVMADANIAEKRLPQDGRVTINVEGKTVDLRVSTLPTAWGEEVAIRILDRDSSMITLEQMGFSASVLEGYRDAVSRTLGSILVTGPTGSGKSTTLYATLNILNEPSRKIITVEDPIEYRLPGLRQIQVHPYIGLTFADALRSILRSDPDVIMIGEIRDRETAAIAVHSAMTGHLVLSTLHTNDAPTTPTRLIEMGVEPFLVGSAVNAVIAQRLARRICPRCADPYTPDRSILRAAGFPLGADEPLPVLHRPVGCRYCADTGYRGRVALAELMIVTEAIERLIVERRPSEEIRAVALEQGLIPLAQDGMIKVRDGLTTIEEVIRVTS